MAESFKKSEIIVPRELDRRPSIILAEKPVFVREAPSKYGIKYDLVEYHASEGWLEDEVQTETQSVKIGKHILEQWENDILTVSIPKSVKKGKIVSQKASASIGSHVRISPPIFTHSGRTCSWNVASQVHDKTITFSGTIGYVVWGEGADISREIVLREGRDDQGQDRLVGGKSYIGDLNDTFQTFVLYLEFMDGMKAILTPANKKIRNVEVFLNTSSETKNIVVVVSEG